MLFYLHSNCKQGKQDIVLFIADVETDYVVCIWVQELILTNSRM